MTTLSAEWKELSVTDRAAEAWAAKADLESNRSLSSFRDQAMRKLKLRTADFDLSPDHFDDEIVPHLRLAAFADGLTFCLTNERELAVIAWECAESGCTARWRGAVSDYATLGRVIQLGAKEEAERPHCRAHKKKGERL